MVVYRVRVVKELFFQYFSLLSSHLSGTQRPGKLQTLIILCVYIMKMLTCAISLNFFDSRENRAAAFEKKERDAMNKMGDSCVTFPAEMTSFLRPEMWQQQWLRQRKSAFSSFCNKKMS